MNKIQEMIKKKGMLTPEFREEFRREYCNRGVRALAALDEKRVKKYLDFTVVESSSKEYIVDEDICTCGDFIFRGRECWHILAVRLAEAAGAFTEESSWYQERWTQEKSPGK